MEPALWRKFKKTKKLPKALANQPSIQPHLRDVMRFFSQVSDMRQCGIELNRVTLESWVFAVRMWTDDVSVQDDYVRLCLALDQFLVSYQRTKKKTERERRESEAKNAKSAARN